MPEKQRYYFYGAPLHVQVSPDMPLQERLRLTGNNTGNLFIAYAVEKHLGTPDEAELIGREIDVDRINSEYDKVIIPASNFVNSYSDLGEVARIIERINIPLVVIGIGSQASKFTDKIELKKGTIKFLSMLSEKSVTLGVRGNFTAEKLFDIGIKNVDVIGCPTIYFNSNPDFKANKKPFDDNFTVAINFGRRRENLHLLKIAMQEQLSFIAQSELLELSVMEGIAGVKEISKDPLYKKSGAIKPNELVEYLKSSGKVFYNIPEWISEVSYCDFVLGPRLHGNMIAFQHGVPALWFKHDTRTSEICDLAKLPGIAIEDIEKFRSVDEFYNLVDFESFNRNYPLLYNNYIDFLEKNQVQHSLKKASPDRGAEWKQLYSYDQYQRGKIIVDDSGSVTVSPPRKSFRVWIGNIRDFVANARGRFGIFLHLLLAYLKICLQPVFDREWYFEQYLKNSKQISGDSIWHYLNVGWKIGNNPSPLFDVAWYRRKNFDVAEADVEPLLHYLTNGWHEGRSPSPLFDISWYKRNYSEVLSPKIDPFTFYLRRGWKKGHNPNPFFDVKWYLKNNPDVTSEPLTHYIKIGWKMGLNPSPNFDAQAYLKKYPDINASGMEPLTHYLKHGQKEKRNI